MSKGNKTPSIEHLKWLVDNRSRNQASSVNLYEIIDKNRLDIRSKSDFANSVQALVAVIFSLWRAVFLADLEEYLRTFDADYEAFLLNLIQHNTVTYASEKDTRSWSFVYYVNSARYRLQSIANDGVLLPKNTALDLVGLELK